MPASIQIYLTKLFFKAHGSYNLLRKNETRTRYFHISVPITSTPDIMTGRVNAINQALEQLARQIARYW